MVNFLIFILISPFFDDLVGKKAPDFTLKTIDGDSYTLSDNFGKVIVLDIMTTSCPACIEEMEHLRAIYNKYSSEDVMIVTISIDSRDKNSDLRDFKRDHGDDWIFARDTDDVANKYKVRYTPTTVIIDREGIIRYLDYGELSEQKLSKEIDKLI